MRYSEESHFNTYRGEKDLPLSKGINQAVQGMSDSPNTCAFPANKTVLISTKRNGKIYPLNNASKKPPHTQR